MGNEQVDIDKVFEEVESSQLCIMKAKSSLTSFQSEVVQIITMKEEISSKITKERILENEEIKITITDEKQLRFEENLSQCSSYVSELESLSEHSALLVQDAVDHVDKVKTIADNMFEKMTQENNMKRELGSVLDNQVVEFNKYLEEARRVSQFVEEKRLLVKNRVDYVEESHSSFSSSSSSEVDVNSVIEAAETALRTSKEIRNCEEVLHDAIIKAKEVYEEISSNMNIINTPDIIRSSKMQHDENMKSQEKIQNQSFVSSILEMESIHDEIVPISQESDSLATNAMAIANSMKTFSQSKKDEKQEQLILLIQKFYEQVEEARKEATFVAETANMAAEKADVAENIRNNIMASAEVRVEDSDVDTIIEAAENSKFNADGTVSHSNIVQEIIKDVLDIFEEMSEANCEKFATPDIVRSIKMSCSHKEEVEDSDDYDLIKDCEACIFELTTIEEQINVLKDASEKSAASAETFKNEVLSLNIKQSLDDEEAAQLRLEEERLKLEAENKLEEEERLRIEEGEKLRKEEEEERLRFEEEERLRLEEEKRLRKEEEERLTLEEEERVRLEEERVRLEEEERLKKEERLRLEEEERLRKEEEEGLIREEEERMRLE